MRHKLFAHTDAAHLRHPERFASTRLMRQEFGERTAWSLFNSFTAVTGQQAPWRQMESTLRLTRVFRGALSTS